MKICEEYAALLDAYADGELSCREMERVRAHLEVCPDCRAYMDDLSAMRAAFPEAEDTPVPEGFADGVMARVAVTPQTRAAGTGGRRRMRRLWGGAAAAACVALVLHFAVSGGGVQDILTRAADGAPREAMDSGATYSVAAGASASGQESAGVSGEMENVPQSYSAMDSAGSNGDAPTGDTDSRENQPQADNGRQYALAPVPPTVEPPGLPAARAEDPGSSPAAGDEKSAAPPAAGDDEPAVPPAAGDGEPAAPPAAGDDGAPAVSPTVSAADSAVPPPDLSIRISLSAEDADLLAGHTPAADEEGRTCWLLEPEEYGTLLLMLEARNSQATVLHVPEEDAGSGLPAEKEELPAVVYLAEG